MKSKMIKISNRFYNENCYLKKYKRDGSSFQLCDKHGNHIDGYFLFGIYHSGLVRDNGIGEDIYLVPPIDTDYDNNHCLKITGVDEL